MIRCLLWDVDRTLLDFGMCERNSLKAQFAKYGLGACEDATVQLYTELNLHQWEKLERGEIDKDTVMTARFEALFSALGITGVSPAAFSDDFENGLADTTAFMENAYEIVQSLQGVIPQYAVTNGASAIQRKRLKNVGLDRLFDGIFISDEVGYDKPCVHFFEHVFSKIPPFSKDEILIVGDSLTSDMKDGINAGIKTCRYNPDGAPPTDLPIDFEIHSLSEIYRVLNIT